MLTVTGLVGKSATMDVNGCQYALGLCSSVPPRNARLALKGLRSICCWGGGSIVVGAPLLSLATLGGLLVAGCALNGLTAGESRAGPASLWIDRLLDGAHARTGLQSGAPGRSRRAPDAQPHPAGDRTRPCPSARRPAAARCGTGGRRHRHGDLAPARGRAPRRPAAGAGGGAGRERTQPAAHRRLPGAGHHCDRRL